MNHSLAAVASRIQERNNALTSELATLDLLRARLSLAEIDLASAEAESTDARVRVLNAVRARHGTEIGVVRATDDARRVAVEIDVLRAEIERWAGRSRDLESRFRSGHGAPAYAEHETRAYLYATMLGDALESAKRRRRDREGRLGRLRERTAGHTREADEIRLERDRISIGFAELDRREEEDDEETMALGMQIKSVLAKVRIAASRVTACFSCIIVSALMTSEDFDPDCRLNPRTES